MTIEDDIGARRRSRGRNTTAPHDLLVSEVLKWSIARIDELTGPDGLPIADYRTLWAQADLISFGF